MRSLTIASLFTFTTAAICCASGASAASLKSSSSSIGGGNNENERFRQSDAEHASRVKAHAEAINRLKLALSDKALIDKVAAADAAAANEKKGPIPPPSPFATSDAAAKVGGKDFWDICDQVTFLGFACEHHTSVTEDGFELDIIRIPPQPAHLLDEELIAKYGAGNGYPMILQHGLIDSASAWVANYFAKQNLGTMLSAAGYDVFMPNARGNSYSMKNSLYSNTLQEYWQRIDMDFMAKYDMPANINYVLNVTQRSTLSYVGHSQGGMMGFGAFSTWQPQLATKVDYFFALAPACWVHHTSADVVKLLAGLDVSQWLSLFGMKGFLEGSAMEWAISQICPIVGVACALLIDVFCGVSQQTNTTQMATMTRYTPGGTSVNNMIHWSQEVNTESWATHDYGAEGNLKYWGQATNPIYTPNAMTGPKTVVFYGANDALADPTDVETLLSQVPAAVVVEKRLMYGYAHLDFTWGVNAHIDVYPTILGYVGNLTSTAAKKQQ